MFILPALSEFDSTDRPKACPNAVAEEIAYFFFFFLLEKIDYNYFHEI